MNRVFYGFLFAGLLGALPLAGFEFAGRVKSGDGAALLIDGQSMTASVYDRNWKIHVSPNLFDYEFKGIIGIRGERQRYGQTG